MIFLYYEKELRQWCLLFNIRLMHPTSPCLPLAPTPTHNKQARAHTHTHTHTLSLSLSLLSFLISLHLRPGILSYEIYSLCLMLINAKNLSLDKEVAGLSLTTFLWIEWPQACDCMIMQEIALEGEGKQFVGDLEGIDQRYFFRGRRVDIKLHSLTS
jgi:hypothetical protein